jgi:hypothetical protein
MKTPVIIGTAKNIAAPVFKNIPDETAEVSVSEIPRYI